jgi:hypothetical protein
MKSINVNQKRMSVKLLRLLKFMGVILMALVTLTACPGNENGLDDENGSTTVDKDGLTKEIRNIVTNEYLAKFKAIGIEINGGNKPPNIEGTYLATPLMCIKSSFPGDSHVGLQMVDAEITFSEQNNAKLTVFTNFIERTETGGQTGKGTGSFITGSGNKFTVFVKMTGTLNGLPLETIDIYSGEISSSGIKNYYSAQMMIKGNIHTNLPEGEVRLFTDSDGLAERIK